MIITGKRKRKLDKKLFTIKQGTKVVIGLHVDETTTAKLKQIGFTKQLNDGETVLPPSDFGPICKFNSEGKEKIHRDQAMETAYRQIEWTWEQWAGRYETETQSKIVDVPYKRYPRTLIPPPSIELSIVMNKNGEKFLVTSKQKLNFDNPDHLIHCINIFLEIFNQCNIMTEVLDNYSIKNVKQLNWHILPHGKYPWEKVQEQLKPIFKKEKEQKKVVIRHRLEIITRFDPEFVAIGQAGFSGYLIFGFPRKNLYILESLYYGNATYIFEEQWETLSRLTKAEILTGNLQRDRIIHRVKWDGQIKKMLS
jgi:hypothetical protein